VATAFLENLKKEKEKIIDEKFNGLRSILDEISKV
jgi:hypothetical protein